MAVTYTHTFELRLNGKNISGEVEFNLDGQMGYKTTDPIEWNNLDEATRFQALLREFKVLFDAFDGINKIELLKK